MRSGHCFLSHPVGTVQSVKGSNIDYFSADLGVTAQEVQRNLDTFFALSSRWGCILLLDEADILLESRSMSDIERNSIVSGRQIRSIAKNPLTSS